MSKMTSLCVVGRSISVLEIGHFLFVTGLLENPSESAALRLACLITVCQRLFPFIFLRFVYESLYTKLALLNCGVSKVDKAIETVFHYVGVESLVTCFKTVYTL